VTGPSQRALLEACFRAAVAGVDAARAVCREVGGEGGALVLAGERVPLAARLHVVAAGKAAAAMAAALEDAAGDRIAAGVAVTKDGHGLPLRRIELREAAHPVPDARSVEAARAALAVVAGAAPGDWIVGLLSGGASSLLACPLPGLSLDDVRGTTDALLACGAPIEEVNAVRKHLTAASGGRLAQAARAARVLVLALSDVIGDDASVIGSGPFAADPTTYADALRVLARRGARARIPRPALAHLEAGARGRREESAKPGDPALARVRQRVVASSRDAVEAACAFARSQGVDARALGAPVQGEAREVGRRLAALGLASAPRRAALLVAGGETTVTIAPGGPRGLGGRCQELVLAAALALEGTRVALLAAGTDGTDGPTDAAGAFADGGTVARGRLRGRDAARDLAAHDGYGFFSAEGGLLRTGPTRTHALDLALVYCAAFSAASASG
jgi:hydroxypyruvate reductase